MRDQEKTRLRKSQKRHRLGREILPARRERGERLEDLVEERKASSE